MMLDFTVNGREVDEAYCGCGGRLRHVEPSAAMIKKHACDRKDCCCVAIKCSTCKRRITFALAPRTRIGSDDDDAG